MGDRLWMGKPSRYVTNHPDQLSLAIPPWLGAMSTSESWGVNGHTARYSASPMGHLAWEGLYSYLLIFSDSTMFDYLYFQSILAVEEC